jgi:hypothetical protein
LVRIPGFNRRLLGFNVSRSAQALGSELRQTSPCRTRFHPDARASRLTFCECFALKNSGRMLPVAARVLGWLFGFFVPVLTGGCLVLMLAVVRKHSGGFLLPGCLVRPEAKDPPLATTPSISISPRPASGRGVGGEGFFSAVSIARSLSTLNPQPTTRNSLSFVLRYRHVVRASTRMLAHLG